MEDHSEARAIEDWAEDLFMAYGNTGDWYPAAMLLVAEVRRLRAILDEDPSPFDYS